MSGDDSFFGPSRTSQPAQLHLRSRHAPDTPGESDADTTADATFFGAPRHRHPVVHDLSTMEQVRTLERAQADIDERQAYLDTTDLAAEAAALHALTPATRAQVEAYRQQVRQEARAEARADFASSVGESFIEGNYEGEEYDEDEDEDEEEGDVEIAEADDSYESEGSSDIFDPDNDPVGFAERLDELAGVMEMGEVEARALRWGPSMGGSHAPDLPIEEFKALINHHLTSTEWRFEALAAPGAMGKDRDGSIAIPTGAQSHPIRVLGRWSAGRAVAAQDVDLFSPR